MFLLQLQSTLPFSVASWNKSIGLTANFFSLITWLNVAVAIEIIRHNVNSNFFIVYFFGIVPTLSGFRLPR
jgi:hypothetical protein